MTNNPNAFVSVPREPSGEQLKFYGYAPGDYFSQCIRGGHIVGGLEKRATCCLPCARAAYKKFIDNFAAAPSAPVVSGDEELRKALERARDSLNAVASRTGNQEINDSTFRHAAINICEMAVARIDAALKQGGDRG